MHKAVDCGYKLIVVLTSDNEDLRRQTQKRIDTDFIGYHNGEQVGVGKYLSMAKVPRISPLTNDNDFGKDYAGAFKNVARPTWNAIAPMSPWSRRTPQSFPNSTSGSRTLNLIRTCQSSLSMTKATTHP